MWVDLVELVSQEDIFHGFLEGGADTLVNLMQIMITCFQHSIITKQLDVVVYLLRFEFHHLFVSVLDSCCLEPF